ncbi:MAG TPA: hypothetical protein PL158_14080 [Bacillota bacterium]|jgi:hypothetical protein|nr:hypothetical protein [Bacillota bacterium]
MQNKSLLCLLFLITVLAIISCTNHNDRISAASERKIVIDVKAGKNYSHQYKMGFMKINITPQLAIWLEDETGKYIDTILVTKKSAKSSWGNVRRPEALPIWSHKRGVRYSDGLYMPDRKNPLPDAVTGATAKGSFVKTWVVPSSIKDGDYRLKVEVNCSFDFNETYQDKLPKNHSNYNLVSGQPSLLWEGKVSIGKEFTTKLKIVGHGHPAGKDGTVFSDLSGIDSSITIINSITASSN